MNKEDIINTLNKYNLDSHKYIVLSGAAMVMLGIKDKTHDIDIAVTPDYYEYLKKKYDCKIEWYNGNNTVYFIDDIINFGLNYYNEDHLIIEGIPVQTEEDIIKIKRIFNREKDIEDIKKIKKYMGD